MRVLLAGLALIGITCSADAAQVHNFFAPVLEGARIDACLDGGACGKPAADAFCRVQGYDNAMIFQRESFASTRALDSGKLCSGRCSAFKQVKCFTRKSDLAGL